jgi:hypothetical protein
MRRIDTLKNNTKCLLSSRSCICFATCNVAVRRSWLGAKCNINLLGLLGCVHFGQGTRGESFP